MQDGDRFWKLPECYIRGNSIKYLRIPDEVVEMVAEEDTRDSKCIIHFISDTAMHLTLLVFFLLILIDDMLICH
jgi:hypothetical protein